MNCVDIDPTIFCAVQVYIPASLDPIFCRTRVDPVDLNNKLSKQTIKRWTWIKIIKVRTKLKTIGIKSNCWKNIKLRKIKTPFCKLILKKENAREK